MSILKGKVKGFEKGDYYKFKRWVLKFFGKFEIYVIDDGMILMVEVGLIGWN